MQITIAESDAGFCFSTQVVPNDRSGSFHSTYHFLTINWKIIRWVVIGALVLEVNQKKKLIVATLISLCVW